MDDLASITKMYQLVFPDFNNDSSGHDHGINVVALDCEWRPEGYYKDNNDIDVNRKLLTEEKWANPAYTSRGSKKMIKSEKKKSSDNFNLDALKDKIKKYSKKINDLGKKSLSSLLEMNEPTLDKNSITFTLPSKVSLSEFEKEREAFTIFLQTELNNYNIKVLSKVEEKKNGDYFSSPSEKLTKLIEINPMVGRFKEDLKLDL